MVGQLVIHIGDSKTGSSSIQKVLFERRWRASDLSIAYPPQLSSFRLANRLLEPRKSLTRIRALQDLGNWVAQAEGDFAVISAEQFSRVEPAEMDRVLRKFVPGKGGTARLIACVRPHPHRFPAAFAQRLRAGFCLGTMDKFQDRALAKGALTYAPRFAAWHKVFGERFTLRPFLRDQFFRGDVVADFIHSVTGHPTFTTGGTTVANESVSLPGLTAIRAVQRCFTESGLSSRLHHTLGRELAQRINQAGFRADQKLRLHDSLARKLAVACLADARALDRMFFADQPILEPALDVPPGAYLEQAQSLDIGCYFPARVIEEIQARATVLGGFLKDEPKGIWQALEIARGQAPQKSVEKSGRKPGRPAGARLAEVLRQLDALGAVITGAAEPETRQGLAGCHDRIRSG